MALPAQSRCKGLGFYEIKVQNVVLKYNRWEAGNEKKRIQHTNKSCLSSRNNFQKVVF